MKKTSLFSLLVVVGLTLSSCIKDKIEKQITPKSGEWVGSYAGSNTQEKKDIGFTIDNNYISKINVAIYFTNLTFYKIFNCNCPISNNSFKYEQGQITTNGGKTIIQGNFTSETECNGTVSFEENSTNGVGQAHYSFSANIKSEILVSNIASLRAGAMDGTVYKLTSEAVLIFATSSYNRNHKFIQDATGGILIDDTEGKISTVYNRYDGITGITGTLLDYRGMLEFIPTTDPGPATSTGNSITPQIVSIQELNTNFNRYESTLITVRGVSFDVANGSRVFVSGGNEANYFISLGSQKLVFRVHYAELDYVGDIIPSGAQNITGVAIEYNGVAEIFARDKTDIAPVKRNQH
jgi:hypothetical protein